MTAIGVAGPVPEIDECVTTLGLDPSGEYSLACVAIEDETTEWPFASGCISDEAVGILFPEYPRGPLVCFTMQRFDYLGTPGICFLLTTRRIGCAFADKGFDNDDDGEVDEVRHCVVWVAGASYCWYD